MVLGRSDPGPDSDLLDPTVREMVGDGEAMIWPYTLVLGFVLGIFLGIAWGVDLCKLAGHRDLLRTGSGREYRSIWSRLAKQRHKEEKR